jgi:hypothetical protein
MLLPYSIHKIRKKCVFYTGEEKCSICLNLLNKSAKKKIVMGLPCGHLFHCQCIKQWEKHTCPLCRHSFFFKSYHAIDPWINNKYHRCQSSSATEIDRNVFYPYNCRYNRSYFNLVLYQLRSFLRHRVVTIDRAAFEHAEYKVDRLMRGHKKNIYFKN